MTGKESPDWTLAFRTPRANRFHRVTDWAGTWQEAFDQAGRFGRLNPHLQVFYVPTRAAELAGSVVPEDHQNILTEAGRRVPITEDGTITHGPEDVTPGEMLRRRMSRPETIQTLHSFGMSTDQASSLLAWIRDLGMSVAQSVPAAGCTLTAVPDSPYWDVTYPAPSDDDLAALIPRPAPEPAVHALPSSCPGVSRGVIVFALHCDPEAREESAVIVVRRDDVPESRAY